MAGVLFIIVLLVLSLAQAQETDSVPEYMPISFASNPALCAGLRNGRLRLIDCCDKNVLKGILRCIRPKEKICLRGLCSKEAAELSLCVALHAVYAFFPCNPRTYNFQNAPPTQCRASAPGVVHWRNIAISSLLQRAVAYRAAM